jgi:anti-sigma factor RsiW
LLLAGAGAFGMAPACMPRAVACWLVGGADGAPALVARAGRSGVLAALAACVLTLVGQRVLVALGDTSAWFGALHVLKGTVIGLLT